MTAIYLPVHVIRMVRMWRRSTKTRSEADVREAMMSSEEENIKTPDLLYPKISPCGKSNLRRPMVVLSPTIGPRILNLPPATPRTPTLHPLTLPYKTQHHLLTTLQAVLEECCFDFGRLWLPEVLKARSPSSSLVQY